MSGRLGSAERLGEPWSRRIALRGVSAPHRQACLAGLLPGRQPAAAGAGTHQLASSSAHRAEVLLPMLLLRPLRQLCCGVTLVHPLCAASVPRRPSAAFAAPAVLQYDPPMPILRWFTPYVPPCPTPPPGCPACCVRCACSGPGAGQGQPASLRPPRAHAGPAARAEPAGRPNHRSGGGPRQPLPRQVF